MISTLQKLTGLTPSITDKRATSINFNANLPITIEVLKQLEMNRYRLKLGRKELTTKSQKNLKEQGKYWGNFYEAKGGILTLSNLCPQPQMFHTLDSFLEEPMAETIFPLVGNQEHFKHFLLTQLSDERISKKYFGIFAYMLLALHQGVVHLPFLYGAKRSLLQFKYLASSQEPMIQFYGAFENLGPIEGVLKDVSSHVILYLSVAYEKSLYYLQKEIEALGMEAEFCIKTEIAPLYDMRELLLDMKG